MIDKESDTIIKDIKSKADMAYLLFMNGEMSLEDALEAHNKVIVALNVRMAELKKKKKDT